jgi:transcriptional regulator with XRE-family HTH domain
MVSIFCYIVLFLDKDNSKAFHFPNILECILEQFQFIDLNQEFDGRAIRKKRDELGLSARQLAEQLQVDKGNLYKWEKGHTPADPQDYIKITNWLGAGVESVPRETVNHSTNGSKQAHEAPMSHSQPVQERYIKLLEETVKEKKDQLKELQVRLDELAGRQADFLARVESSIERYEHLFLGQLQSKGQLESGSSPTVLHQPYKSAGSGQKKNS